MANYLALSVVIGLYMYAPPQCANVTERRLAVADDMNIGQKTFSSVE